MQTKSEMINRIAELAEEVEQWKHEYEALDACLELAQSKIAELKAENERMKSEIKNNKSAYEVELGTYNMECGNLLEENKELAHYLACMTEQRNRANTCLQEIKETAEKLMADNLCNNCDGIGLDANCQDTGCPYYQMEKILQKITKTEEE